MSGEAWLIRSELTQEERERLLGALAKPLAQSIRGYTQGDTSSVPSELAEMLFSSLCYTLERCLHRSGRGIATLLEGDVDSWLEKARAMLAADVEATRALWQRVCATAPALRSETLMSTLYDIGRFFDRYDQRYLAQEIPCMIDYPALRPVPDENQGVDWTADYLARLYVENALLSAFDPRLETRVVRMSCADYETLPVNLCLPVLSNAVGCLLADADPRGLLLTRAALARLQGLFAPLDKAALCAMLHDAGLRACERAGIHEDAARRYVALAAEDLAPRILAALPDGLGGVFACGGERGERG